MKSVLERTGIAHKIPNKTRGMGVILCLIDKKHICGKILLRCRLNISNGNGTGQLTGAVFYGKLRGYVIQFDLLD
jgi:hypothetical protein